MSGSKGGSWKDVAGRLAPGRRWQEGGASGLWVSGTGILEGMWQEGGSCRGAPAEGSSERGWKEEGGMKWAPGKWRQERCAAGRGTAGRWVYN